MSSEIPECNCTTGRQLTFLSCLSVLVCAFLLHQHHRRSSLRRGAGDGREAAAGSTQVEESDKNKVAHCTSPSQTTTTHTISLLELQLLKPPRANGQPAWISNPNIAGKWGTKDVTHAQYATRSWQVRKKRYDTHTIRSMNITGEWGGKDKTNAHTCTHTTLSNNFDSIILWQKCTYSFLDYRDKQIPAL